MTLAQLKTIEDKINKVETEIDKNEMAAAMNSMISTAEAQVRYLSNVVNTILHGDTKDGKLHFNTNDRKNVDIINNQVLPIMNDLRGYIRNRSTEFDERESRIIQIGSIPSLPTSMVFSLILNQYKTLMKARCLIS